MSLPSTHAPPSPASPPVLFDPRAILDAAVADPEVRRKLLNRVNAVLRGRWGLDPDEVVNDAIERSLRHAAAFDPTKPAYPWLQGVLGKLLMEHDRRLRRFPRTGYELSGHSDPTCDLDRKDDLEAVRAWVEKSLSQLSPQTRDALRMRYADNLGYGEIAERLRVSRSNARKIVSRGYQTIERLNEKSEKGGRS